MTRIYIVKIIAGVVVALTMSACGGREGGRHEGHDEHGAHCHEGHFNDGVGHDEHEHGDDEIVLERHRADELGVEVTTIEPVTMGQTLRVSGRVLLSPGSIGTVSAPSPGKVRLSNGVSVGQIIGRGECIATISADGVAGGDVNRANKIQLETARQEYERLKGLLDDGLATIQEFNAAKAAYSLAQNAVSATSGGAVSPIAGVITAVNVVNGQYVEAGETIATVSTGGGVTLEVMVPVKYSALAASASHANLRTSAGVTVSAKRRSMGTVSADNPGYIPVYFDIDNGQGIVAGSVVEATIVGGEGIELLAVPVEAVIERLGQQFVYVREDEDCYERRPVITGRSDGQVVEIVSGIESGDIVVTAGTAFVRLAETSGAIPEGHTHNH